jgi:hypothetical protein
MRCSIGEKMADETLLLLAREIRGKTLRLLEGMDDRQARFAAPGLNNTILWHAGHAVMLGEHLGIGPATGKPPAYPPEWFEKFSWKSNPSTVASWPSIDEVRTALREQLQRLISVIEPLTADQLNRVVDAERGRTLRFSILHGLHDEADHQGEIHLLKKLYAKR